RIHPQLVGSDIGCGMGLFQLDVAIGRLHLDKAAARLSVLDAPWQGNIAQTVADAGLAPTAFDGALGTIGGANHFCEIQAIEEIVVPEVAATAGLDRSPAYLLAHSRSPGLGLFILHPPVAAGAGPP